METRTVRLAAETDFQGWRDAARALRAEGVPPDAVLWTVDRQAAPFPASPGCGFTVPRAFLDLGRDAVLHRSDERFALLYRVLWRLGEAPGLLDDPADPDVARLRELARDVDRALQKMKAFARFRLMETPDAPPTEVAWFEPAHRVTERAASFFMRRFAGRSFAVLTPDVCVGCDGERLRRTPGVDPADAPAANLEDAFLRDYVHVRPIADPFAAKEASNVANPPSEPDRRLVRAALSASRDGSFESHMPLSLEAVSAGVDVCRRCELWRDARQGVAGEGPQSARLMLVGEQPGEQEDLNGRPFVGPAGGVLDRALEAAGASRAEAYVTNAVKHFKHELRGKRRLHRSPDAGEVRACRWWLDAERRIVRPRVIVALGATAALAVFDKPIPIARSRGRAFALPDGAQGVVTYHPSYVLRLPDPESKSRAFDVFVEDLRFAWSLSG